MVAVQVISMADSVRLWQLRTVWLLIITALNKLGCKVVHEQPQSVQKAVCIVEAWVQEPCMSPSMSGYADYWSLCHFCRVILAARAATNCRNLLHAFIAQAMWSETMLPGAVFVWGCSHTGIGQTPKAAQRV